MHSRPAVSYFLQKITGICLVVLGIWFIFAFMNAFSAGAIALNVFFSGFWNVLLVDIFFIVGFYHAYLGLRVMIQDYVHHVFWTPCLVTLTGFSCLFGSALVVYALVATISS